MRVWLAEKAPAGRDIAKALGGGRESEGAITLGNGDVVTWARGHLLESAMPHDYDERYRKWRLEDLPILPERFKRIPVQDTMSILRGICRHLAKAKEVVVATDAGREGEAIAWFILDYAKWTGPTKRFWANSLNQSHLKTAVHALLDASEKKPLYVAARLRSSMDWLDGVNYSRYYNIRSGTYSDGVISVGRVQTATLALIVDRDQEIENFKSKDYFEIRAGMDTPAGPVDLFHRPVEAKRITDRAVADAIAAKARGVKAPLKVESKARSFAPPPPFSLPQLQITAAARWGWSSKKTLEVLQGLYEKGAVTYPRTDSSCLTDNMKQDMPKHLAALRKRPGFEKLADIKPTIRKTVFDSSKVDDHHGIIPTDEAVSISSLGPEAAKLFDLVARRFLACLMPDAEGTTTTISADLGGTPFRTSGTIINKPGWKAVWGKDADDAPKGEDDETRTLPPVRNGDIGHAREVEVQAKRTQPPDHYTEGTIILAMKNVGAKQDAEIRDLLSGGGIGTQATRHESIEKIKMRGFVRKDGKKLIATQRGREFIGILRDDGNRLADPLATADLERRLRSVEKDPRLAGPLWNQVMSEMTSDIMRLRKGPAPRKLTAAPPEERETRSRGKAPARSGGAKRGTTAKPRAAAKTGPAKTGARKRAGTTARKPTARRKV